MKVHINPTPEVVGNNNGIGRVIKAQYQYLPQYDIELVKDPRYADVIAGHISGDGLPRVDIMHCHGVYWTGDKGSGAYSHWHEHANSRIAATARQARLITVPSEWVAEPFRRDMRIDPVVIGHGIDIADWNPLPASETGNYVLWNKNRRFDVCDPTPAYELALRQVPVMSTFNVRGKAVPDKMQVTGSVPWETMRELIHHAGVYLATTQETYGIGVLEAMAAGVPVLGYRHGGTATMVEHGVTGYLVEPGDIDGLVAGYAYILANRAALSEAARAYAIERDWPNVIGQYAHVYEYVYGEMRREKHGVTVVITNYNYGRYVGGAIESVIQQTYPVEEIIVVDDGSTDESIEKIKVYTQKHPGRVKLIAQKNMGVAAARNNGIAAGTQPFVICLDADDRLGNRYVELTRKAMLSNRALGVAYTGLGLLGETGSISPNAWPPEFDWESQSRVTNPPSNCVPCAAMFRRTMWERAGGYLQVYAPAEDTEFFTRGLSIGFEAERVTEEALFHYRAHSGSASRTKVYKPIDTWHPWMRDKQYPFAAPAKEPPPVRSYSRPLISVVIPVGDGHEKYLASALDSLLGQTVRDWEVVVADDTRDEIPVEVLRPYPFVKYMRVPEAPAGAGAARNVALEIANAPLVLFLDADDYLFPPAMEDMLRKYVETGGTRYVYTQYVNLMGDGSFKPVDPEWRMREYSQAEWLKRGQHAIVALVPRCAIDDVGGFDEHLPGWEDWDFFIKLAIHGHCGVLLDEELFCYRMYSGTRRESSRNRKQELIAAKDARYSHYLEGNNMPGCGTCGDGGQVIIDTKRRLGVLPQEEPAPVAQVQGGSPMDQIAVAGMRPGKVRMKYIGSNYGAITFFGKHREYRGGLDPLEQFKDVEPEDVDKLLGSGRWELVRPPAPVAPPPPPQPPPPPPPAKVEPVPAPQETVVAEPEETHAPLTAGEILRDMADIASGHKIERVAVQTTVAPIPDVVAMADEPEDPNNTPLRELPPVDGGLLVKAEFGEDALGDVQAAETETKAPELPALSESPEVPLATPDMSSDESPKSAIVEWKFAGGAKTRKRGRK